ncbi:thiamine biosynthesis protein ThiF [Campylobacter hyointestinalis]|uniref:sulfur carrier protein ThiS adenylyltransferase ThiF n=1 Tax=Campylobacter hyointestinalis TaxID=198 RepID=UPI00072BD3A6|nr:sulfur carrier protein ThiS adenylyltransferase ThiF [Campylobacter hyointestinalis]PPB56885.1 sulfur carrier protein ThiS adenylyltransferase [Campylobacter hyointestinalis subsp. hyointestinalis]CUU74119.1 thiamine biosynthesis protein ThiF [Campylobacter hyointestinalis]CUU79493.1 thiamine biosynthesis protein ThiF [Campylobacter hyointestinalis subsp. hyointestinalis]
MKNIRVNSKDYKTCVKDLAGLKAELNIVDELTIYKGFSVSENLEINDGDSIVFIKKGQMPSLESLEEMMSSRNSPEVTKALKQAKVGIAGLGGLGSSVAIALGRVGTRYLKLVDFDTVDPSNLNRQQYFIKDIGRFKTEALCETMGLINPFVKVEFETIKLDETNVNDVFKNCDVVCECFDNPTSKAMLINSLKNKEIVAASGMAGYGRSEEIKTLKLAKNLYICGDLVSAASIGNGLMAPRVGICAMHQANKVLEILINKVKQDG